jgi:ATP-dependent HslUV protease subunit HslV
VLRRLEALLVVADLEHGYLLSGSGELIEPDDGIVAVGSGGNYALAAARALLPDPGLGAREIVQRSLDIAADICVFTNRNLTILELPTTVLP